MPTEEQLLADMNLHGIESEVHTFLTLIQDPEVADYVLAATERYAEAYRQFGNGLSLLRMRLQKAAA